jgi:hypothetical protein
MAGGKTLGTKPPRLQGRQQKREWRLLLPAPGGYGGQGGGVWSMVTCGSMREPL